MRQYMFLPLSKKIHHVNFTESTGHWRVRLRDLYTPQASQFKFLIEGPKAQISHYPTHACNQIRQRPCTAQTPLDKLTRGGQRTLLSPPRNNHPGRSRKIV
jgi:hypothetical protein